MGSLRFFQVKLGDREPHNSLDLSAAARVWSEDPEHRKVFEIIPTAEGWKPIREFSADELRDTFKKQPAYSGA
jgi:hypothetical protein